MRRKMERIPDPKINEETLSFWKSRFGVEPKEVFLVIATLPFLAVAKVASSIRDATLGRVERGAERISAKVRDIATGQKRTQTFVDSGQEAPEFAAGEIEYQSRSFGKRVVKPVQESVSKVSTSVAAKVGKQKLTTFEDKKMIAFLKDEAKK